MAGDLRSFKSNYLIPREVVEALANEVPKRQVPKKPDLPPRAGPSHERPDQGADPAGAPDVMKPIGNADPPDADPHGGCTANWKAAASDDKKHMWDIFDECGIFASACRHGSILWVADMVQSGELYA